MIRREKWRIPQIWGGKSHQRIFEEQPYQKGQESKVQYSFYIGHLVILPWAKVSCLGTGPL